MKITSLLPLVVAAVVSTVPAITFAAKNATLSIITNNVYFLSETLFPNWGQRTRAKLIAKSDYIKNHDIVVFQECFENTPCQVLKDNLRSQYPYQTPTIGQSKTGWHSTSGWYSVAASVNGGVAILSKWPILKQEQYIYGYGCGADWFANKGFAYILINYKGTRLHVFGTHMQSDDPGCTSGQAARFRSYALDEWRKFIDSKNIPADEHVIMTGDFNIKRDTTEFSNLLTRLDARQPNRYDGHPWSWDTHTNEIAHYNHPNSSPEYIDFVLIDKKHKAAKSVVQTVLKVNSPQYVLKSVQYHEYSDHYPVRALIEVDL
ncbi:hypothetical protein BGZ50_000221 [Haplosporangium sp. Z 11]|nr:hypothetical protein BGZ50_000221 [Haplosporangium sp. Z 11]